MLTVIFEGGEVTVLWMGGKRAKDQKESVVDRWEEGFLK